MTTSNCKQCGKEIRRRGDKPGVFCSLECKGEWQQTQKPVDKEWLIQKYVNERLGTYEIGKLVNRNPKQVWHWLRGYNIPIREREWETELSESIPYHNAEWLRDQYIDQGKSASEIAMQFEITIENIHYFLHRFNIPIRSVSEARAVKYWGLSGDKNPMYGKRGSEGSNWKGGFTPERQGFYSSIEWSNAVKIVWARDKGTCQRCGVKANGGPQFHIHHIISFAVKEYRAEPTNLILLCKPCHNWVHSKKNVNRDFIKDFSEEKGGQ